MGLAGFPATFLRSPSALGHGAQPVDDVGPQLGGFQDDHVRPELDEPGIQTVPVRNLQLVPPVTEFPYGGGLRPQGYPEPDRSRISAERSAMSPAQLATVSRTVTTSGTWAVYFPPRVRTLPVILDSRKTRSAPRSRSQPARYQWPRQHSRAHGSTRRGSGRAAVALR